MLTQTRKAGDAKQHHAALESTEALTVIAENGAPNSRHESGRLQFLSNKVY
jgi:hypothetical protein